MWIHTHAKNTYISIYTFSFITKKNDLILYILKIRPFSTQLRIYTALRWKRGEKKQKKLKSVNTQIFPLTRCPFSASLHFTSDFIFKLWASDNSAQFFFPPGGRSSFCLLGKKLFMNTLIREAVNKHLMTPWSPKYWPRCLELNLSSGQTGRGKL